jgi:hypothetical protein
MQLKRELRANKSKEKQGKLLVFPWIYLAESGLFKELRRIQIKKTVPPQLALQIAGERFKTALGFLLRVAFADGSGTRITYSTFFRFLQSIAIALSVADDMSGLGSARSVR